MNMQKKSKKSNDDRLAMYVAIGVVISAAVGLLFDNIGIGLAIGAGIGAVIGAICDSKKDKEKENDDDE